MMIRWLLMVIGMMVVGGGCLHGAPVVNLGEVSRDERGRVVAIEIRGSSKEVEGLAKRAFGMHGGYKVVSSGGAFVFVFDVVGQQVRMRIESGGRVQYEESFGGGGMRGALYRAFDVAVRKTYGIPGFFSGEVLFVGEKGRKKEVYLTDMMFQEVRQVTHDGCQVLSPRWSGSGRKMVYTSYYRSGFPDIFVVDLDSGKRVSVASYKGTNTGGAFSPDGNRLAMILTNSGNAELYVADGRGENVRRLTRNRSLEASPVWSRDGEKIYFTSDMAGGPQIFEISANGGGCRRIATRISSYCAEPAVNFVHGNMLAFTAAVGKTFQVAVYDFSTGHSRFITQGREDHIEPCWLKDGRHLVVTRRSGKSKVLCVVDSVTGKETALHGGSSKGQMASCR